MDDQILELLSRIDGDDPPSDEELRDARATLREALDDAANPGEGEKVDLKAVRALRKGIDSIDSELKERREAADQERAEVAKLLEGLDDSDTADAADGDDEDDGEPPADDDAADADTADEREPVAASFDVRELGPALKRARARRAARRDIDDDLEGLSGVEVVLSGPAAGDPEPQTFGAAADLFGLKNHLITRGKQTLIELQWRYPRARSMTANAGQNTRLVESLLAPRSLVAAGGICDPLPADFSHPICGDRSRPIRDALPRFGATRGGVRFAPAATLSDVSGGVGVWPEATDADPGTMTKNCLVINCEDEVEVKVDAIYRCLEVGNFAARFNPEFWQSRLDLLMVAHDRLAEQTLFATMQADAVDVTAAAVDGNTVQSLFLGLDKASAGIRSRNRLTDATTLRFIAPAWLRDALVASIVRQAGRAGGDIDRLISVARARVNGFFADRNIDAVWSPDLQVFDAQTAGPLEEWPTDEAVTLLFPEGSYFYLDGGTLDLGIEITDSTLNQTNDRQAFAESFENVAYRGCEALEITVPVGEDCVCEVLAS